MKYSLFRIQEVNGVPKVVYLLFFAIKPNGETEVRVSQSKAIEGLSKAQADAIILLLGGGWKKTSSVEYGMAK